jgi:hypothetical protein
MFLPIGDKIISGLNPPTDFQLKTLTNELMKFYVSPKFERVSELAARFALWNLPENLRDNLTVGGSFGLWLSLVWIIDDLFDKDRQNNGPEVKEIIVKIIKGETPPTLPDHLVSLSTLLINGFTKYRDTIGPHGYAYHKIQDWLLTYLDNLFGNEEDLTLVQYENWRLIDGAMMCVAWHLVHYMNDPTQDDLEAFRQAALYISYQNDLLSYQRDLKENTPNLVKFMDGKTHWEKYQNAINHLNTLWVDIQNPISRLVILGSYNWALTEPRYVEGKNLLSIALNGNHEDFPRINARGNPDPRQLYMKLYYGLSNAYFNDRVSSLVRSHMDNLESSGYRAFYNIRSELEKYHPVTKRGVVVRLPDLKTYIRPTGQGLDSYVIFPEHQLIGVPRDIVDYIRKYNHLTNVDVGLVFYLTRGEKGSPAGNYPLTEQLIYDNSIDLHAPGGDELYEKLKEEIQKVADIVGPAVEKETSPFWEFRRLGRIEGYSNGSNLQGRKQAILNRMIQSLSPYYFPPALTKAANLGQNNVFGFRSYQEFVQAQTNFVNGFSEDNVRTVEVLLNQIVPVSEYLLEEEHMPVGSSLRGLFMSNAGKIIFI